jgi:hypothetical protein
MRRWTAVAAIAALGIAVGAGIAWASIPDANGVLHTCYKNSGWRVIDAPAESCKPSETPLAVDPGAVRPVIRTETHTIHPGEGHTFTAHCNAGEVATGAAGGSSARYRSSHPGRSGSPRRETSRRAPAPSRARARCRLAGR